MNFLGKNKLFGGQDGGGGQKLIVFSFLLVFLIGCNVKSEDKKNEKKVVQSLESDIDGDGISDKEEEVGSSSFQIADLPKIYTSGEISSALNTTFHDLDNARFYDVKAQYEKIESRIFSSFTPFKGFTRVSNEFVRKKLLNLSYKSVFESNYDDSTFPTMEDALLGDLGCLNTEELYKKKFSLKSNYDNLDFSSHKIDFKFKYLFDSIDKVSEISFIEAGFRFKSILNDEAEFVGLKSYTSRFSFDSVSNLNFSKLFENKLSLNEDLNLPEYFSKDYCLFYEIQDFKYKRLGKELIFSEVKSNVESSNAHIFISTKEGTQWISIAPEELSFKSFLDQFRLNYKLTNKNEITSFNGLENQIQRNIHIEDIIDEQLGLGRWFFFSTNGEDIYKRLQAGSYYYLVYADIGELLESASFKEKISLERSISDFIEIQNSFLGDRIEIIASLDSRLIIKPEVDKYISGFEWSKCEYPDGGYYDFISTNKEYCGCGCNKHKAACKYTEKNENHSNLVGWKNQRPDHLNPKQFEIIIEGSNRVIKPIFLDNKRLAYNFRVNQKDIRSRSIRLRFNNKSIDQFKYKRVISKKHRKKQKLECDKEKIINQELKANKLLKFNLEINRTGIIR